MEHKSMKRMRLLPLCAVAFMAASVSMLLSGNSSGLNAAVNAPVRTGEDGFPGREYVVDGIHYYIPFGEDTSRDAAVVSFPNHAVIPSYITVKGTKYTVREIRKGAAQTDIDDPDGWVTLPPTLKRAVLSDYYLHQHIDFTKTAYTYGVQNVVISDLDSFLNMEMFDQSYEVFANEFKPGGLKGNWKLYLNGVELKDYDYVYPEGSPMGTSLNGLIGVKSITVPASDTARTTPLSWTYNMINPVRPFPKRLQFKADSGYNTSYYDIYADTIVLPNKLKVFNGYGLDWPPQGSLVIKNWPETMRVFSSTNGIPRMRFEDVPQTVSQVGNDIKREKTCTFEVGETVRIPSHVDRLENVVLTPTATEGISTVVIEDSDEPLYISGEILLEKVADSPEFYIGRSLVDKDDDSHFYAHVDDKTATITVGEKVTMLPGGYPIDLRYTFQSGDRTFELPFKPQYLVCRGMTPPDFRNTVPDILEWRLQTVLVIPEGAEEAYRNHYVWKQFKTIQTTGVDETLSDKEVVGERWISLDGRTLTAPEPGRINIQVTTYSDGTTTSRKVAVSER